MMIKRILTLVFSMTILIFAQSIEDYQKQVKEAEDALKAGNLMGSEMLLQGVLMQDSTFAPAYYAYHDLALQKGDLNEAIRLLNKAIANKLDDEGYRARYEKVNGLANIMKDIQRELESGETDNVIRIASDVIKDFPNYAEAYYLMGVGYLRVDNYVESSKNFRTASELNPDEAKYSNAMYTLIGKYYKEGMDALKFGDYTTAEEKLRITIEIDPTFVNAYMTIGSIKRRSGDLDGAIHCLEKGVEAAPDDDKSLYNLGSYYSAANRNEDAKKMYLRAIEVNPDLAKAYSSLAKIYEDEKKYTEAEANYKRSLELDPTSAPALEGYGAFLLEQKRYSEAKQTLEEAVKRSPKVYTSYFRLAECYNNLGEHQKALDAADRALKIKRNFAPANIEKGFALYHLDRIPDAINAFMAARTDPAWRSYAEHQANTLREGKPIQR